MSAPQKPPRQHPWEVFSPLLFGLTGALALLAVIVWLVAIWSGLANRSQWENTAVLFTFLTALSGAGTWFLWAHKEGRL